MERTSRKYNDGDESINDLGIVAQSLVIIISIGIGISIGILATVLYFVSYYCM